MSTIPEGGGIGPDTVAGQDTLDDLTAGQPDLSNLVDGEPLAGVSSRRPLSGGLTADALKNRLELAASKGAVGNQLMTASAKVRGGVGSVVKKVIKEGVPLYKAGKLGAALYAGVTWGTSAAVPGVLTSLGGAGMVVAPLIASLQAILKVQGPTAKIVGQIHGALRPLMGQLDSKDPKVRQAALQQLEQVLPKMLERAKKEPAFKKALLEFYEKFVNPRSGGYGVYKHIYDAKQGSGALHEMWYESLSWLGKRFAPKTPKTAK